MTYEEFVASMKKKWADLLMLQYRDKPKARKIIENFVEVTCQFDPFWEFKDFWNIDKATGYKLDLFGNLVGIDRNYIEEDLEGDFICFITQDTLPTAYNDLYGLPTIDSGYNYPAHFISSTDVAGNGTTLNDDVFREMIKFKILSKNLNESCVVINEALRDNFGEGRVYTTTTQNMDITYFVPKDMRRIILYAKQKRALPHPACFRLTAIEYDPATPFISFITQDTPKELHNQIYGLPTIDSGSNYPARFLSSSNVI